MTCGLRLRLLRQKTPCCCATRMAECRAQGIPAMIDLYNLLAYKLARANVPPPLPLVIFGLLPLERRLAAPV